MRTGLSEQIRAAFARQEKRGLKQARIIEALQARGHDVHASTVSRKLKGKKAMPSDWCEVLADILSVRISWDGRRAS